MTHTILGAGGTIGAPLAKELQKYPVKIRLVSRNPKPMSTGEELFPADLSNPEEVDRAIAGSDVVYLLVGFDYNIKVWREKWPKLMRATLDACKKHRAKLVFFDNVYMYDPNHVGHLTEETPVNPSSKKGKVRAEIAQMILDEVKAGTVDAIIARAADFYGPNNEKSVLMECLYKTYLKKKTGNWFADANKKHSFTFTPDAAKATAILGNTPDAFNQIWHLPTDPNTLTGNEFAALFAKEMGVAPKIAVLPVWMMRILGVFIPFMREFAEMAYQYNQDYFFDSSKFEKRFGVKATPYTEGVTLSCKQ